jgi:hypothetical protein
MLFLLEQTVFVVANKFRRRTIFLLIFVSIRLIDGFNNLEFKTATSCLTVAFTRSEKFLHPHTLHFPHEICFSGPVVVSLPHDKFDATVSFQKGLLSAWSTPLLLLFSNISTFSSDRCSIISGIVMILKRLVTPSRFKLLMITGWMTHRRHCI